MNKSTRLQGAWQSGTPERRLIRIYSDRYFSESVYSESNKTFESTAGGAWKIESDELVEVFEFDTAHPERVGTSVRSKIQWKGKELLIQSGTWTQLDEGMPGALAGAWLITGRMVNGEKTTRTPGPRKTMKILSGTRFQWIAYNVDTKEFFGTGGGTYTTKEGKYSEHIEFFSRDNTRVGMDLSFDFALDQHHWLHKGLSSKGEPIDEVWTQREVLEKTE